MTTTMSDVRERDEDEDEETERDENESEAIKTKHCLFVDARNNFHREI